MKKSARILTALLVPALALISGCVVLPVRPEAANLDSVGKDEIVVVGRVRLDPALKDEEQSIERGAPTEKMFAPFKDAFIATGDAPWGGQAFPDPTDKAILKGAIEAKWDQWFFARFPRRDFYVQLLTFYTRLQSSLQYSGVNSSGMAEYHSATTDTDRAYFPADLKIRVRPEDRVLFIGTLVFHRGADNQAQGLDAHDDFDQAKSAIAARLGDVAVRDALPKRSKDAE